ncbi:MAG: cytochrome C oxidase subunit IV family protein [Candidatus Omnitrophota bacterium]|nr:cytochrome C oxidase subunit IV family protein [Candidatus Omnitrophota bacterium]MDZ4242687.1 cytochrome C oxidase subunit IV family protein [Candidatus Omnitrophota bacterium]
MHSDSNPHEIKKEVKVYLTVFGALLFLTLVTVGVSYLHLNLLGAVILALVIASIKAALVACFFMHLISERAIIYIVLIFTVIFFLALVFLPLTESHNVITGTQIVH